MSLQRWAMGIEYNGARFVGWQSQSKGRTVQQTLEQALGHVANHPVVVLTAGRTDTGVHATGQVVHFDSSSKRTGYQWLRGSNTRLPDDVRVQWAQPVEHDFHARFSALSRRYRFIVFNCPFHSAILSHESSWDYRLLNVDKMQRAADTLIGEHDFSSFRAAGCQAKSAVRTISELQVTAAGKWLWIDIEANAFLQHMVRNIAGVLLAIGAGERPVSWISEVLEARDRARGGKTADPQGLFLTSVAYPQRFLIPPPPSLPRFW